MSEIPERPQGGCLCDGELEDDCVNVKGPPLVRGDSPTGQSGWVCSVCGCPQYQAVRQHKTTIVHGPRLRLRMGEDGNLKQETLPPEDPIVEHVGPIVVRWYECVP